VLDPAQIAPETLRPLYRAEYDRLVALGTFEGQRIELLRGALVAMSPQNEPHSGSIQALTAILTAGLRTRAQIRVQLPLAVSEDSEPEPDLAVVKPGPTFDAHPSTALLVIEVAADSLRKDRAVKGALYAAAGVPEYWIVDLAGGAVEVYTEPGAEAYGRMTRHLRGEILRPAAFPDVEVPIAEILPPA